VKAGVVCGLCGLAALVDFAATFLVGRCYLPLYLDCIGSMTIAWTLGLIPALAVSAITAALNYAFIHHEWQICLFVICGFASSVITCGFARFFPGVIAPRSAGTASLFERCILLFGLSCVLCIVMSLMGGVISTIIGGMDAWGEAARYPVPENRFKLGFLHHRIPVLAREILSRLPVNILDRPITVFTAFAAAAFLRKTRLHFPAAS
jgi:hypothetical protein